MIETVKCYRCRGQGYHDNLSDLTDDKYSICRVCNGRGTQTVNNNLDDIVRQVEKIRKDINS